MNVFEGRSAVVTGGARGIGAAVVRALAESGVRVQVIARVLNHIDGSPRATKAYDRHTYDAEKLRALQTWERRLDHVLIGTQSAVVPFRTTNP